MGGKGSGPRKGVKRPRAVKLISDAEFAQKINKFIKVDPESGCHIWIGKRLMGYAIVRRPGIKGIIKVHRYLMGVAGVKGVVVCHKCDIPYCVNVDHLYLGTQKSNVQDMIKRGRHRYSRGWAYYANKKLGYEN